MAFDLRMPKLGMSATKGTIAKWFKAEGEEVNEGEPLIDVLTDKVTFQVESPRTGLVRKILVPVKREVPVGTLLAWIGSADEEIPVLAEREAQAAVGAPIPVMAAATSSTGAAASAASASNEVVASPAAKRMAKEQGVDLALVKPSGADGRVSSGDVLAYVAAQQAAAETEKAFNASPAAKRLAQEIGLDLSAIARTLGDNRRITSEDVEAYLQSQNAAADSSVRPGPEPAASSRIPLEGIRKAIADHLVESLHNAAQLTISLEVDATELVNLRERILPGFEAAIGVRPTFTDLLVVLTTKALQQHPLLNSTTEGDEIILHQTVNMGVAVAIESGLIVPVIPGAQKLGLGDISRTRFELARKASEGRIGYEDVQGGTFTITNIGGAGADISTPILNSPQNAILGVGRIAKKPAVYNDEICVRHMLWLNVTFDHRAMDGAPVARFLDTLSTMIQKPVGHING